MKKPRIFLGSSGKQAKLLQAITRGLKDIADVEPWTTTFNPGRSTLDRLVELSQEVDFAAFVFAQDDWTTTDASQSGQASPRDNVVFEAGLFGGVLGMRRTFILHANDSKLPSDLLGLTSVRYDPATSPAEVRSINQKLRRAIEAEGRRGPIEGLWWQLSLTVRTEDEPSAVSLLRISRDRDGGLCVNGRGWQEDGTISARYWSEAAKERRDPAGVFYYWKGERPRDPNAPQLEGTGEIKMEAVDRASGYWTTRSDRDPGLNARTSGIYMRADPSDLEVLDDGNEDERAQLIAQVGRERILTPIYRPPRCQATDPVGGAFRAARPDQFDRFSVVVVVDLYLAADLAGREVRGVDVRVGVSAAKDPHRGVKAPGGHVLRRHRHEVCSRDRPCDRALLRTRRRPCGAVPEVGAQEEEDAADYARLPKVQVRLRDIARLAAEERQPVGHAVPVDRGT